MRDAVLEEEERAYMELDATKLRNLPSSMLADRVATLVRRHPICVPPRTRVGEAITRMQDEHVGCVLVTEDEKLVGIFTERDVLRGIAAREDLRDAPVSDVMTCEPTTLSMEATVAHALLEMALGGFRHVPLVDSEGRPARIVSVKDIVDFIVEFFSSEVLNLPPDPRAEMDLRREGA